jgi:hypothetical protein
MIARFDEELNLYWVSNELSQHIQNIEQEPRIFVTIHDSRLPNGSPEIDALYLEMRAEIMSTPVDIAMARRYSGIDFSDKIPGHEDFLGDCPRRFVRAIPVRIWHHGDTRRRGHTIDARFALTAR